ncbi:hypothetical protein IZ6_22580 [Terrihabitans soli]|uniref:DUF6314 domain-containing protein n=1 Tax=Terrihabitans soli TaxID=708113 RepID=A0A6S6QJR2_9HYPH|nr:DUF6314 family protein [Terrihabitans soli]BCJ91523.1 hypothetical protein IZ6_22580 [Terrihabitans soli]
MLSARLFDALAGSWRISRTIDPQGALDGTASFSVRDNGWLAYSEEGELTLPHGQFTARRSYLFEPREDGFAVWFDAEPKRLFHEIALDGPDRGTRTGSASHLCRDDLYLSEYSFEPDGRFSIRHRVTGPYKDYTVNTLYTRPEAA